MRKKNGTWTIDGLNDEKPVLLPEKTLLWLNFRLTVARKMVILLLT